MAKAIAPKFVWDLTWPQGRFMNDQSLKNLCLQVFYFCKILKMCEKILWNPLTSFLYCIQREDKATVKSW